MRAKPLHPLHPGRPSRHRSVLRPTFAAAWLALDGLVLASLPGQARAQALVAQTAAAHARAFDIPAGPLASALHRLASSADVLLSFTPEQTQGRQTPGVRGTYTVDAALQALLAGTGLRAARLDNGAYVLRPQLPPAAPAQAGQTVAPPSTAALPAVTVTADGDAATGPVRGYLARRSAAGSKTDTPIIETPQSLSVVTAERIEAIGATTVRDALGYTPGINISPYGADSRYDWISIRGFDAYSPGFYQDGLPLRNANTFAVWKVEPYGTERIDVLRGPASVLYGQASPGGVVDVVSKLPTALPVRELQMQVGSHGHKQIAGDFSGKLDAEGQVRYRVVGLLRDARMPTGDKDDDRTYLAPSLTWRLSGDTSLTLYAQLMRNRAGVYTRIRPIEGSLVPTPVGSRIPSTLDIGNRHFDRFDQDQTLVGYQFEHRLNDTFTFRQNLRAGHMKLDYAGLQAPRFVATDPEQPLDPANYRLLSRTLFGSRESARSLSLDNQLQADLRRGDWQHTLLLGLDHQRSRFEARTFSGGSAPLLDIAAPVYPNGPFEIPDPYAIDSTRLQQTGLYLQDQIKWGERWQLTLGGRYDQARTENFDRLGGASSRVADHRFTKRAGLVYLAPNGLAPYASYTESFNPNPALNPLTRQPFEPETGRQYEAGLRYQPPGSRSLYSAAIFDLRRRNYITFDPDFVPYQTGEISTRGLELEATTQPMPRMNLTAAYSYTPRAIVTASANPEQIGRQALAVPRNQLSGWIDYRFTNGLKVGIGARHTGSTYGNGGRTPVKVPAYTLVDLLLAYDIDRWSLALNVRNLTNRTYLSNCDSTARTCYYGDQRRVVATATYRW